MYYFPNFEPVHCSMSDSNCCVFICNRFLGRQVRCFGIPISLRIFQFVVINIVKFGLGVQNEVGQRLIEFCQENTLIIANTLFQNTREDSTHGHHQMANTEIRLIIFLQLKMEKLYTVSKNKTWSWMWLKLWTPYWRISLKLKKVGKTTGPLTSVQLFSHVLPIAIPWTTARQASLSTINSQSTPKLMSIESVMSSNHLILCPPLLLLPSNLS